MLIYLFLWVHVSVWHICHGMSGLWRTSCKLVLSFHHVHLRDWIQTWSQTCSLTEAILTMPEIFADSIFYLKIFVMIYKNRTTVIIALQGIAFLLISQKTINFLVFYFDWLQLRQFGFSIQVFQHRLVHTESPKPDGVEEGGLQCLIQIDVCVHFTLQQCLPWPWPQVKVRAKSWTHQGNSPFACSSSREDGNSVLRTGKLMEK